MSSNPSDWSSTPDSQMAAYQAANPGVTINGVQQPVPPQSAPSPWSQPQPPLSEVSPVSSDQISPLAVVALVFGLFAGPLGVLLGIIALFSISRTGERGRGLAIAGIILGFLGMIITMLFFLLPWYMISQ